METENVYNFTESDVEKAQEGKIKKNKRANEKCIKKITEGSFF